MVEVEPRRELADQKPFVIRGHHLLFFAMLVNKHIKGGTPQMLARRIRREVERAFDEVRYYPKDNDVRQEKEEYAQDVLGRDLEQADKFEEHLVRTFGEFLRLPDNHPAEIVEEVPDIICAGCAVGEHCHRRLGFTPSAREEDRRFIDAFLERVSNINRLSGRTGRYQLPEPTIREQALFSDAEPNVRKISTILGVVKRALNLNEARKAVGNDIFRKF